MTGVGAAAPLTTGLTGSALSSTATGATAQPIAPGTTLTASSPTGSETAIAHSEGTPSDLTNSPNEQASGEKSQQELNAERIQFLQEFTELLQDLTSIDVLIALLLMQGSSGKDDENGGPAGAAFLAGVVLAGMLTQKFSEVASGLGEAGSLMDVSV